MPPAPLRQNQKNWIRRLIALAIMGAIAFVVGVDPDLIGVNLTPAVGIAQMGLWMTGLAMILVGGYAAVRIVRNGRPSSLRADIGTRLIATGYVFSGVATLADYLGIGTQRFPNLSFGAVQVFGLVFGMIISLLGLALYWPRARDAETEESDTT
jgi:hypothetical protein